MKHILAAVAVLLAATGTPAAPGLRPLPAPLYGATVDDVANLSDIVASSAHLPQMPTTRIYFDVRQPASHYANAVRRLEPVSYLMGELLDSSDEKKISVAAFGTRVRSYLAALGSQIDLWEIGNEVNGNWTGSYRTVSAKLTEAYQAAAADRYRTALTLYYNVGCGDGPGELTPVQFSTRYVPRSVRDGLDYVLLSYYESDCKGIRPSPATWTAYFQRLHTLYPNARMGFGEVGLNNPVTGKTLRVAESIIGYYYGLPVKLPYYVGGYFWWYYDEDCLPYTRKPLWPRLSAGFEAEAAAIGQNRRGARQAAAKGTGAVPATRI